MSVAAAHWPAEAPRARQVIAYGAFLAAGVAVLYVLLPTIAGLDDTWRRIRDGEPLWLIAAVAFEMLSYAGYLVVFRGVVEEHGGRMSLPESAEITFAGVAATRLLATAGAGGIALSAWALRRSGMRPGTVAETLSAFFVLLYSVYMGALVVVGLAVGSPPALTLVPAAFGALVIALALALALVPRDLGAGRTQRVLRHLALAPAAFGAGVRNALDMVRRARPWLLGAPAWWAFDIAVLWAAFHAFGQPPEVGILVMAYFVGMLGNLLPLPGGIGGVDGGMIGACIGFGVATGLAIVAVLTYRAIAFWLPSIPGVIAYLRLRRRLR